ncbi:hypothetical protein HDU78_011194 [Chytriomyces hyalinus]|nr:hypothetical protein HDU78_011194 [Chytriomyces hyalinus]
MLGIVVVAVVVRSISMLQSVVFGSMGPWTALLVWSSGVCLSVVSIAAAGRVAVEGGGEDEEREDGEGGDKDGKDKKDNKGSSRTSWRVGLWRQSAKWLCVSAVCVAGVPSLWLSLARATAEMKMEALTLQCITVVLATIPAVFSAMYASHLLTLAIVHTLPRSFSTSFTHEEDEQEQPQPTDKTKGKPVPKDTNVNGAQNPPPHDAQSLQSLAELVSIALPAAALTKRVEIDNWIDAIWFQHAHSQQLIWMTPALLLCISAIGMGLLSLFIMLVTTIIPNSSNSSTPRKSDKAPVKKATDKKPAKKASSSSKTVKAEINSHIKDVSMSTLFSILAVLMSLVYYETQVIPQFHSTKLPEPTLKSQRVLEKAYSNTGLISVAEDPTIHGGIRVMRCDHSVLGGIFLGEGYRGDSVYGCFYILGFVAGFERFSENGQVKQTGNPAAAYQVLNIGLGIGVAASMFLQQHPKSHIDVLELDPNVIRMAVTHFNFPNTTQTNLLAADGRAFMEKSPAKVYDYVLHDVFTNGGVSGRLVTLEALEQAKRVLVDDGILALNFAGTMYSQSTLSLVRTIKTVFPYVACYPEGPVNLTDPTAFYNMAFFASAHPLNFNPTRLPDIHARANAKKKTTSDGGSMGHMRMHMLETLPSLRHDDVIERVELGTGEAAGVLGGGIVGSGVVLRDRFVGVHRQIVGELEKEERVNRKAHWDVMVQLFGAEFWLMF